MHLLRLVVTHPVVFGQMEKAARENKWAEFRAQMAEIDVDAKVLIKVPFVTLLSMKSDSGLMYPDMHIVMHVSDSGIPWNATRPLYRPTVYTLNTMADYKRVGNHSISWGFSRASHRLMRKEGFSMTSSWL